MGWFHKCDWIVENDFKYRKKCQRVVNFPKVEDDKYWKIEYEDDRIYIKKNGKRLKWRREFHRDHELKACYGEAYFYDWHFEQKRLKLILRMLNDENVSKNIKEFILYRNKIGGKYSSKFNHRVEMKGNITHSLDYLIEFKGLDRAFEIIKNYENY